MKTKQELLSQTYATLAELEHGISNENLERTQRVRLGLLYEILGDDIEEEYWERIENEIYK